MARSTISGRPSLRAAPWLALTVVIFTCCGADGGANPTIDRALRLANRGGQQIISWYWATPPAERIPTGGLLACGILGGLTIFERLAKLRRRRILPNDFMKRFKDRMDDVKLERGKILDLCELNPSPASRVALAAVKRWGRPTIDLERAVTLAARVESDLLRRNVGTLRRIAAMAPLLGLLGTLLAASRALKVPGVEWGPAVASALLPLTAGVAMAILSLVVYDGMIGKVEKLIGSLERLGAETVDAISLAVPPEPVRAPQHSPEPTTQHRRQSPGGSARTPHQYRVDLPNAIARAMEHDDDLYDL